MGVQNKKRGPEKKSGLSVTVGVFVALTLSASFSVLKMYVRSVLNLNWTALGNALQTTGRPVDVVGSGAGRWLLLLVEFTLPKYTLAFPARISITLMWMLPLSAICSAICWLYYWHQWLSSVSSPSSSFSFTLHCSLVVSFSLFLSLCIIYDT